MKSRVRFPEKVRKHGVTVTIYRNKHPKTKSGWIYQVCHHAGGRRFLRQFTDYAEAKREAAAKAIAVSQGEIDAAQVSKSEREILQAAKEICGGTPIMAALQEWKRVHELTGGNAVEAGKLWKKIHATDHQTVTLAEAVALFKQSKEREGVDVAKGYKNRLERVTGAFPTAKLTAITTRQLDKYLEQIEHPASRNTHRRNIVTLFTWCRKQGYLPDTVRTAADNTTRAKARTEAPIEVYTVGEAEALLQFVATHHPRYIAPAVLGMFAGLRRGETHAQTWEDIDLEAGTLYVTAAKPGTPADRFVELSPLAREWLMLAPDRTGSVCHGLAVDALRKLCRQNNLATPRNGLRHSFISYSMGIGKTAGEVASQCGTSERQIHKHYRRPATKAEAQKFFNLTVDAVLSGSGNVVEMEASR